MGWSKKQSSEFGKQLGTIEKMLKRDMNWKFVTSHVEWTSDKKMQVWHFSFIEEKNIPMEIMMSRVFPYVVLMYNNDLREMSAYESKAQLYKYHPEMKKLDKYLKID